MMSSSTTTADNDNAANHSTNIKKQLRRLDRKKSITRATTHNTAEKKHDRRLQLHCTRIERQLQQLKEKLTSYDVQGEREQLAKQRERELQRQTKRPRRKGPEFWTLKGAARPAHLVYDFDTRYQCPHQQAHEQARLVAQRSVNLLSIFRKNGEDGITELTKNQQEEVDDNDNHELSLIYQYLDLLLEFGYTSMEAKRRKAARLAFLECIDLDGTIAPRTTARQAIIQLYIQCKQYESAIKLGRTFGNDTNVAVCFPLAFIQVKHEKQQQSEFLVQAIKANPYCAWYLAFYDQVFCNVMEYTEDIAEGSNDRPQSLLEEAIEYVNGDQLWLTNNGKEACDTLRKVLVQAYKGTHESLTKQDVEWKDKLDLLEKSWLEQQVQDESEEQDEEDSDTVEGNVNNEGENDNVKEQLADNNADESGVSTGIKRKVDDEKDEESDESDSDSDNGDSIPGNDQKEIDLVMYINMFRTAMDIIVREHIDM